METKVCTGCGEELALRMFYRDGKLKQCKRCTVTRINTHIKQVNDETRDHAENHRERWTELEIRMLIDGEAEGMSGKELAELLGRTYLSVHGKLRHIRKVMDEGVAERPVKCTRDPNYVASAPDEDRWWEPGYYKKEGG